MRLGVCALTICRGYVRWQNPAVLCLLILSARVGGTAFAADSAPRAPFGPWRLVIEWPRGNLPFNFELLQEGAGVGAYFINGKDRVRAEEATLVGRTLTVSFPSYDSQMVAELQPDGSLLGKVRLFKRQGALEFSVHGVFGRTWRFFAKTDKHPVSVAGTWAVTFSDGNWVQKGVGTFTQVGARVEGTFLFPPRGDYKYLQGEVKGNQLFLSRWDGSQGTLWKATLEKDGTLKGVHIPYIAGQNLLTWEAKRDLNPALEDPNRKTMMKAGIDHFTFACPDKDGHILTSEDPRFKGKVVVVAVGGTWCPNCHDEARFLAPYYDAHRAEGLEIVALEFEYTDDFARSAEQVRRFAVRYQINYPILVAGTATPEDTARALPAIDGGIFAYPTTIFIDRAGTVRKIHTGYEGPATGKHYQDFVDDFTGTVKQLLAEPSS
jgi:thiol-disulfide isomerase/thioredoxin